MVMQSPGEILKDIWTSVGGEAAALERVRLTGEEPQIPSSFRVAVAGQTTIAVAGLAAAKAVGGVGEAILMEGAGHREPGGDREQRRRGDAAAHELGGQKGQRSNGADPGPDQRKCPARSGYLTLGGWRHADWQPGQDGGGDGEFVERPAWRIHSPGT